MSYRGGEGMLKRYLFVALMVLCLLSTQASAVGAAMPVLRQANTEHKVVAMTFDDGWDNASCERVRQILFAYGVPATIFPVGSWADSNRALVQRFLADGHELANHSMTHPKLTMLNKGQQEREMGDAQQVLLKFGKQHVTNFVRPPYGAFNQNTIQAAADLGLQLITWSVDSWDWRDIPVQQVVERTLSNVRPGSVILMHLAGRNTVKALPLILAGLQDRGYSFALLSDLFADRLPKPVQVKYQGELVPLQEPAKLISGTTFVPCRELLVHCGWQVHWNAAQKVAVCRADGEMFLVHLDDKQVPGMLQGRMVDGKLYVPIRALAAQMGLRLGWNAETKTASLR